MVAHADMIALNSRVPEKVAAPFDPNSHPPRISAHSANSDNARRQVLSNTRIFGEDFQRELARERALDGVQRAVRELAANIFNVVRGAGRSEMIAVQAQALVQTIDAHRSIAGCAPSSSEIAGALNISTKAERLALLNVEHRAELHATQSMIFGALLIAGSRLKDIRARTPGGIEGLTPEDYGEELAGY